MTVPDNDACFIWSEDYAESPLYGVTIEFAAAFPAAGLNPAKPGLARTSSPRISPSMTAGSWRGQSPDRSDCAVRGEAPPLFSYERIVKLKRSGVGRRMAMERYGASLGRGDLFERAKDMDANDKDIVFVLNPGPLAAAGVDPARVEGWPFAKVSVDDANGRPIEADRISKAFNLR